MPLFNEHGTSLSRCHNSRSIGAEPVNLTAEILDRVPFTGAIGQVNDARIFPRSNCRVSGARHRDAKTIHYCEQIPPRAMPYKDRMAQERRSNHGALLPKAAARQDGESRHQARYFERTGATHRGPNLHCEPVMEAVPAQYKCRQTASTGGTAHSGKQANVATSPGALDAARTTAQTGRGITGVRRPK